MNKFNVGDNVKIIACKNLQNNNMIGKVYQIEKSDDPCFGLLSYYISGYWFFESELDFYHGFTTPSPEPEVLKSQQYLLDRLSEIENAKDAEWLKDEHN